MLTACPHPKSDPAKSSKRLDLAKDALSKGDLDGAIQEANKAIALQSTNDEAYNVRGLAYFLKAVQLNTLVEVNDCLTGVDAEAMRSDQEENFTLAGADFEKSTKLAPDYGEAWSNRGLVANLTDNPDDAVTYLEEALQHPARLENPATTRAQLGWAQFHREDYVQAAKELLQSLQFQPGWCPAVYRLGRVYFAREEWEKASEQFQGVTDDPTCGTLQDARLYLMKSRIEQGLMTEAAAARDACLAISPKSCVAAQCRTSGSVIP